MAHKITAKLDNADALIQQRPGELQKPIVKIECKLTGDGIDVATRLCVESGADAEAIATAVRAVLPNHFGSEPDIFRSCDIALSGKLPKAGDYKQPIEFEVDDEAFESLQEQSTYYSAVRSSFDDAVRKLKAFGKLDSGGVQARRSEIGLLLTFIENCLEAADVGLKHSWYQEKIRRVKGSFAQLFQRTNSSHSGYRAAQQDIDYSLFAYHAPVHWRDRPPTMQ